jgi:hypothetical protein
MIGEVALVTSAIIATASSVGGWVVTIRNNGKHQGRSEVQIADLVKTVGNLPCVKSSDYMKQMGELVGTVSGLGTRIGTLEVSVRDATKRMDDFIDDGRRKR